MTRNELHSKLNSLQAQQLSREEYCRKAVQYIRECNPGIYDWVGIYLATDQQLHLPAMNFVGEEPEHKTIPFGEGICGAVATEKDTLIIDDVNADPRYLACSLFTKSEIVVPILRDNTVLGVLDLDSDTPAGFHKEDQVLLEDAAQLIGAFLSGAPAK